MKTRGLIPLLLCLFPAVLTLAANPEAELLIQQGDAQVRALHAPEALALYDQAAKADPGDIDILLRVSQQCSNLIAQAKSPADALAFAKRSLDQAKQAVALAPANSKAHLALAVAYGRLTDFVDNRAKVEYSRFVKSEADKTLALDPREDFAYHVLGRWNFGIATFNPMLKFIARVVYGGLPDASLEEAARDYKKAIDLAPQRVIHHHELARVYAALGQMDDARSEWEKELTLKPEDNEGEADQKEARAALEKTAPPKSRTPGLPESAIPQASSTRPAE
jgi:tetratricopeptide (TPR) repeat protein